MFRKVDGMEKRLKKIVKGEAASIKLLEKQQSELERVGAHNDCEGGGGQHQALREAAVRAGRGWC